MAPAPLYLPGFLASMRTLVPSWMTPHPPPATSRQAPCPPSASFSSVPQPPPWTGPPALLLRLVSTPGTPGPLVHPTPPKSLPAAANLPAIPSRVSQTSKLSHSLPLRAPDVLLTGSSQAHVHCSPYPLNSSCLLNAYCLPGPMLSPLHGLSHCDPCTHPRT